jgi:hypothetical protein
MQGIPADFLMNLDEAWRDVKAKPDVKAQEPMRLTENDQRPIISKPSMNDLF